MDHHEMFALGGRGGRKKMQISETGNICGKEVKPTEAEVGKAFWKLVQEYPEGMRGEPGGNAATSFRRVERATGV